MAKIGVSGRALAACIFVFLLLSSATEAEPVAEEKRSCLSQSHRFKGKCLSDTNCRSVCHTEGFPGGDCRGFRRRCFCTRNC